MGQSHGRQDRVERAQLRMLFGNQLVGHAGVTLLVAPIMNVE